MTVYAQILLDFVDWAKGLSLKEEWSVDIGIADPEMENIAWLNIDSDHVFFNLKVWDTKSFYVEIHSLNNDEPEVGEFGELSDARDFEGKISPFLDKMKKLSGV